MTAHAARAASLGFGARRFGRRTSGAALAQSYVGSAAGPSSAMLARDRFAFALAGVR